MKNDGFIAISLIYSFVLAFIAVLVLMLMSNLSSNMILKSYSSSVYNYLNNKTEEPIITKKASTANVSYGSSVIIIDEYFNLENATIGKCVEGSLEVKNTKTLTRGTHNITCTVTNKYGDTSNDTIAIRVN